MTGRLEQARAYRDSGLSLVPICAKSKAPAVPWTDLQKRLPTDEELTEWLPRFPGLGIVCGVDNLEVLDIEANAPLKRFADLVERRAPGLLKRLPRVETPTGGRHLYWRCKAIEGNQKLAADKHGKTLIETRGQGGQVLSPLCLPETHPSGGVYKLLVGDLTQIPVIGSEEREILLTAARSLNEFIQPEKAKGYREAGRGTGTKPGEDYNGRADAAERVRELLREAGWSIFGKSRCGEMWSRPGVNDHSSATLYDSGYLYVFSSNATPFVANEAYSPFAVYAELKHSSDFRAAARDLGGLGFGQPSNGHREPPPSISSSALAPAPVAGFRFTTLSALLSEPKESLAYVVDGLLACACFSILCSKPKVGKSTFARALAVAVSTGAVFFGRATKQGKVIYLCLEEKRAEVAEHFRRMGAGGDNIIIHTGATPKDALAALAAAIAEHLPVLIIIDPLSRFIRVIDFNSYAEITRAFEPLIDTARLSGAHILTCHHNGKGGDLREAGDAVMGSTGIFGAVDCLLTMRRKEKVRTIESVQRYGKDLAETIVHLDPETGIIQASGDMETFTLNERKKAVLEAIGSDPLTEAAIKDLVGGTNGGLTSKAVRALSDEGTLLRSGAGKKGDAFLYQLARAQTQSDRPQSSFDGFEEIYFPPGATDEEVAAICQKHLEAYT